MEYENPKIPEGINTSEEHPLKGFVILLFGAVTLVLVLALLLGVSGGWLAGKIPYSKEVAMMQTYEFEPHTDEALIAKEAYLQAQVDEISKLMDLPEEMIVTVHYSDEDVVNAFATLGGHLVFYRGLLEKLPNENALTMLIAHEIAHLKYRHPIKALGRGLSVSVGLSLLTGTSENLDILSATGIYTMMHFSRKMEEQSDTAAVHAVQLRYGHLSGSQSLFETIMHERKEQGSAEPPAFFSSHPLDQKRLDHIQQMANDNGWSMQGDVSAISDLFVETTTKQ